MDETPDLHRLDDLIGEEQFLEDWADRAGHEGERLWHARMVDGARELRAAITRGLWPGSMVR